MIDNLGAELAAAHRLVSRRHEIITCWRSMYVPGELRFVPLPPEMEAIIRSSADYEDLKAGAAPTLVSIASGNEALELVLYRASDRAVYMLAPIRD